jgi:hypothetical protein
MNRPFRMYQTRRSVEMLSLFRAFNYPKREADERWFRDWNLAAFYGNYKYFRSIRSKRLHFPRNRRLEPGFSHCNSWRLCFDESLNITLNRRPMLHLTGTIVNPNFVCGMPFRKEFRVLFY